MTTNSEQFISSEFWLGVNQFNRGEFYACHDTLEAIWMESIEPDRTFYQGILQIAVGLYHLGNHNWRGCVTLMGEGIYRLQAYQPNYSAIAVSPLVHDAQQILAALQQAGPDGVQAIAHQIQTHDPATEPSGSFSSPSQEAQPVTELPQGGLRSPVIRRIIVSDYNPLL